MSITAIVKDYECFLQPLWALALAGTELFRAKTFIKFLKGIQLTGPVPSWLCAIWQLANILCQ
jgi:tellurite resistance protein TehA-like permease